MLMLALKRGMVLEPGSTEDGFHRIAARRAAAGRARLQDRKSTRLNSSHVEISYAVFCLKNKRQRPCSRTFPSRTAGPLRSSSPTRWFRRHFFLNDTATTEIYTLSLHDALPIFEPQLVVRDS